MRRLTAIEQCLIVAIYLAACVWVAIAFIGYEVISWFGRKV